MGNNNQPVNNDVQNPVTENPNVQNPITNNANVQPPVTKKKMPLGGKIAIFVVALLFYTLIVGFSAAEIQKAIIKNSIKNSISDIFDIDTDSDDPFIKDNSSEETTEAEEKRININMNEKVTVGNMVEFTLTSSEWCDEIKPTNTSSVYSYVKDIDGEKFFLIKGKVKNLSGESFNINDIHSSELIINDKYKGSVIIETEEPDGTSFYGEIKPLQTLNLIIYASISDEAYNICDDVVVNMDILTDESHLNYFYSDDYDHESYTLKLSN